MEKNMDKLITLLLCFGLFNISSVEGCLLPLSAGTWESSTRGTWTVSDNGTHSTISNFKADLSRSLTTATLDCKSSSGSQYILGTRFEIFFAVFIDVYTCLDIRTTSVSPNSYVYYIVTPTDSNTGEQFTSDITSACTNSDFETAINTHIVLQSGSETAAGVNFPDAILGNYTVEYSDIDGNTITDSDMDSCQNTTLMVFNNADSNTKLAFTSGNTLLALHYVTSGSSVFVHTYNTDATVSNPSTYSIACWVIVSSSSQVTATVYPNECVQGQSSTSVPYGGQKFVFTPRYTCPLNTSSAATGLEGWQIALIVLGIIALIFIIVFVILYILYMRKQRQSGKPDDEKPFKDSRNSSPDSLGNDDISKVKPRLRPEEGSDSGFDENGIKYPYKHRHKNEREHSFSLTEINNPSRKLQDGKLPDKNVVTSKQGEPVHSLKEISKDKKTPQNELPPTKKQPPIEFPPGKKPIPPTTPKPDADDMALLRIKKERERKELEKLEKQKKEQKMKKSTKDKNADETLPELGEEISKVIKNVRNSSSSDAYETDESEKEERAKKLFEKRKRLANAGYEPPHGLSDAKIVGKKKRRHLKEGEDGHDLTKSLTTREQQELIDSKRRQRKKAINRMAKKKLRSPEAVETSDTDTDADITGMKRRVKRRKKGEPRVNEAPFTEQYHTKKGLERELDDQDFWNEKAQPTVISEDDEEMDVDRDIKHAIQVAPVDADSPDPVDGTSLQKIMDEEADVWEAHGFKGFKLGRGGELPEGYYFDEEGNLVRNSDGKKIHKEVFAKQLEMRKRFAHVFSLPRLIRDSDGRPLGGYKDDEFGPTAEWDYGPVNNEEEEEQKKADTHRPGSGKQVAFSMQDGQSVQATPLNDLDPNQIKGRQLGSAERLKLKDRLFESQPEKEAKGSLPVFFAGSKGGVKPESIYINNAQIERQGSQPKSGMVLRSDTFSDGRGMHRNSKTRASWSGRERLNQAYIPEHEEGLQGISRGKKNIGSDDEFLLLGGSMQKINNPQRDSHQTSHWCSRYERSGNLPIREITEMSDLNMRTAPSSVRPFSGDDKEMRKYYEEFYTDKKYFDHYIETEKLPTTAAVETRGLASHGQQYTKERAVYRRDHQPINSVPPPSELGLRLLRMQTFQTNADSGMESMMTPTPGRPHSADDAPTESSRTRENTISQLPLPSGRTAWTKENSSLERKPPTGRSEAPPSPEKLEIGKKEKSVTIDTSPKEIKIMSIKKPNPKDISKTSSNEKFAKDEQVSKNNMLTVTNSINDIDIL